MQAEAPGSNVLCKWFVDLKFMMQKVSQLEQHFGWPALTAVRRFVSGFHPLLWAGRVTPGRRRIAAWVHVFCMANNEHGVLGLASYGRKATSATARKGAHSSYSKVNELGFSGSQKGRIVHSHSPGNTLGKSQSNCQFI